jgi:hypothetical protein
MALAICDGKNLSAINFSAGCFNGKDAGKKIGGKKMKKVRKIKASSIGDFRR